MPRKLAFVVLVLCGCLASVHQTTHERHLFMIYKAELELEPGQPGPMQVQIMPEIRYRRSEFAFRHGESQLWSKSVKETADGIAAVIENTSGEPLSVDWDRCSFVDANGEAHRLIHSGTRLQTRNEPQPSTTIPPGAKIRETLFPADAIEWNDREWQHGIYLPRDATGEGKTIAVLISARVGGKELAVTRRAKISRLAIEERHRGDEWGPAMPPPPPSPAKPPPEPGDPMGG